MIVRKIYFFIKGPRFSVIRCVYHGCFDEKDKNYSCKVINNTNVNIHSESPWGTSYFAMAKKEERHFALLNKKNITPIKIQECDWNSFVKGEMTIENFVAKIGTQFSWNMTGEEFVKNHFKSGKCLKPLNLRNCVRGGKTELFCGYWEDDLKNIFEYRDINSLYPYCVSFCHFH